MSLLLFSGVQPHVRQADLYAVIEAPIAGTNGNQTVDVVIGNRGELVSRDNFDAVIETERKGKIVCRATTNFITPIAPGESIRALRLQVAGIQSSATERYAIRASIRPWDHAHSGVQQQAVIALLPGPATCVAIKPIQ